jgi:hypothetical protein
MANLPKREKWRSSLPAVQLTLFARWHFSILAYSWLLLNQRNLLPGWLLDVPSTMKVHLEKHLAVESFPIRVF